MSRKCELSGVGVLYGNKVSHSQRKTRRRFEPNIKEVTFRSDIMKAEYRFKVTASCARSVEKLGLDVYLLKNSSDILSQEAKLVRKRLQGKISLLTQ